MGTGGTAVSQSLGQRREYIGLVDIAHWRIECSLVPDAVRMSERLDTAANIVAAQAGMIAAKYAGADFQHIVCSTYLSQGFTAVPARTEAFGERVEAASGRPLTAICHTYECAGWGFALRFLSRHTKETCVLLSIVDLDLCELQWTEHHPLIGKSGFGITTLLLTLPKDWSASGLCAGPYPDSGFRQFIRAFRDYVPQPGQPPIFGPFLRDDLHMIAERLLGDEALSPNLHDRYGHCFGADPWIALVKWLQDNERPASAVTLGSLAFNGYFSICSVEVREEMAVDFQVFTEPQPWFAPLGAGQYELRSGTA